MRKRFYQSTAAEMEKRLDEKERLAQAIGDEVQARDRVVLVVVKKKLD